MENNVKRSQEAGDNLRKSVLVVGLGGIAAAYLVRPEAKYWLAAAVLFGFSIGVNLVSWFTLKSRELARDKAARAGMPPPTSRNGLGRRVGRGTRCRLRSWRLPA